jgi:dTDP-4-dehydrorhamnose reductase
VNAARPVAVTGAQGRLGRAVVTALRAAGTPVVAWTRPDYDLDDAAAAERVVARDLPALIVHCAAWTDVDGCAREPELAMRRNAMAVGELAAAAAQRGIGMVVISTNEVFDGERTDGLAYTEDDEVRPINPYGASKAAGERLAAEAFGDATSALWTIRTAWLYGPPGADFPNKIIAAADRLPPTDALGVVSDEIGSPTYTLDLAAAVARLVSAAPGGIYHVVNPGAASRFDVAQAVLARCRPERALKPISRTAFSRPSSPPAWAVLDTAKAKTFGVTLRPWREALAEYADQICQAGTSSS